MTLRKRRYGGASRNRRGKDSGNSHTRNGNSSSGVTPPARNTACQPKPSINPAATKPPAAPPNEKPQAARVTIKVRIRGGEYSDINAMALGIAPPMPMPQINRAAINVVRELANTINTVRLA